MSRPQNKAIGILGGSFDPIHKGHLHLALEAQTKFHLAEVRFLPCHQNPIKTHPPIANTEDRVSMLKLAISPFKQFSIDLREIQNQNPSYTIDTLKSLRVDLPKTPLVFLLANDTFAGLMQWKNWQEILNYAHIMIANRPGYQTPLSPQLIEFIKQKKSNSTQNLHHTLAGYIFQITLSAQPPIASSLIRQQFIQKEKNIDSIPSTVRDYIDEHKIYRSRPMKAHQI